MENPAELKQLDITRWQEYRDFWLEALQQAPESFSADYEMQKNQPDEVWKARLEEVLQEQDALMIFAFVQNKLVGMIGAYFDDNPKQKHIATIWGAYVKPEHRKVGIAKQIATELIKKISERPEVKKIKTYSVTNGVLAVNVFKNFGFEIVGIAKQDLNISGTFYDVYIMEKVLR